MPKDRIITGIDVGSSKVTTVIASLNDEGRRAVIGVSSTPSKGIKKGVVVDIDEAVDSIAACLEGAERMAGHAVTSAFVSIDGNHIASQNSHGVVAVHDHDGEILPDDVARVTEAARAITLPAARDIVHVIPRGFIVDSQDGVKDPVGMSGIRLEVETNIISGASTVMRNLVKCVQQVGVSVEDLVFAGLASAEAVLSDTEKELGCVLVDIGGGTTKILIYVGGSPAYASVLPVGGQNVTNDLAIGLRTNLEIAEKIKLRLSSATPVQFIDTSEEPEEDTPASRRRRKVRSIDVRDLGVEFSSVPETVFEEIINPRLTEMFRLIGAEIRRSGYGKMLPSGIIVTGGTAETVGVEDIARKTLQMPYRFGVPGGVTGLIDEIEGPAYATAVGLILHGSRVLPGKQYGSVGKGSVGTASKKAFDWIKSFMP